MKQEIIGWYPANKIIWDNNEVTLRTDDLDPHIRNHTRNNNGLSDEFIEGIGSWEDKTDYHHTTNYHSLNYNMWVAHLN